MSRADEIPLTATVSFSHGVVETIVERVAALLETRHAADAPTWLNVDTAAQYLGWPKKRLYNLVAANQIPHRKQGNRLLFHRGELDAWLDDYYQGPAEFAS